jgi:uncharacterized protein YgbK (DUF1537 family)
MTLLGVVADDVTGATDVAGAVAAEGLATSLVLGVPDAATAVPDGLDCVVVALKTRTAPRETAVGESVRSAAWLLEHGADVLYQKYCSTFDSTPEGMIGPIAEGLAGLLAGPAAHPAADPDAALEEASDDQPDAAPPMSVGTPASPSLGRTVYQGHLFVEGALLSDSSMRDHPLTPMRDSRLVELLRPQVTGTVALLRLQELRAPVERIAHRLGEHAAQGVRHLLVDAIDDDDLDRLAAALDAAGDAATAGVHAGESARRSADRTAFPLLGGGSGLAAAVARRRGGSGQAPPVAGPDAGERLVIAGSCSARTREQVEAFDGPRLRLDPLSLDTERERTLDELFDALRDHYREHPGRPALAFSCADPDELVAVQRQLGAERAAALIEEAWGDLAIRAVDELAVTRLVLAGGETSGAVTRALGIRSLRIGPAVDPGVSWTVTDRTPTAPRLALLLKSGNFGRRGLFTEAWESCP